MCVCWIETETGYLRQMVTGWSKKKEQNEKIQQMKNNTKCICCNDNGNGDDGDGDYPTWWWWCTLSNKSRQQQSTIDVDLPWMFVLVLYVCLPVCLISPFARAIMSDNYRWITGKIKIKTKPIKMDHFNPLIHCIAFVTHSVREKTPFNPSINKISRSMATLNPYISLKYLNEQKFKVYLTIFSQSLPGIWKFFFISTKH